MRAVMLALEDEDIEVRRHAVMMLQEFRHPDVARALVKMLDDEDSEIRRYAVMGLAEQEDSETARRALVEALDDQDPEVRQYAIMAIAEHPGQEAIPALIKALDDPDAEIRRYTVMALMEFDERDEEVVVAIRKALNDKDVEVRRYALIAIGEVEDEASVDLLIEVLANDEDPEMRRFAAIALGEIGDIRAVDGLTAAMKDENREVRRHAAYALSNLDYDESSGSRSKDDFDASLLDYQRGAERAALAFNVVSGDRSLNERKEKIRLLSSLLQTSKASSIPPDQIARITRELDENKQKVALYQQKQNVLNYRLQDMNTRAYRLQSQAEQASQSKLASRDEPQREALSLRSNAIDRQRAGMNVQIYDLTTSLQQLKEEAAVRSQEFDEVGTLKALIERAEETGATDMCEIVLSVLDEQDTDRAREAAKELNCDRE
jgi:HEAT repeat protein